MRAHFFIPFSSDGPGRCAIRDVLTKHGANAFPATAFSRGRNKFIKESFLSVDRINTGNSNDRNLVFSTHGLIGQLMAGRRTER